jgi:hypothetical protein
MQFDEDGKYHHPGRGTYGTHGFPVMKSRGFRQLQLLPMIFALPEKTGR